MRIFRLRYLTRLGLSVLVFASLSAGVSSADKKPPIDFNRDIRPLLSNHCYACHGPDSKQRQAGLRLDDRKSALSKLESESHAIVPGNRTKSEVWKRITSKDLSERMPPAETGKPLTAKQIELIGRWIDQGAQFKKHWAFIPPKRPEIPKTGDTSWIRNPIDNFILAKLKKEGLKPSPTASKTTLIRRVTFDLTGLPPTIKEIDDFLADKSPNAYEKVVDRLLKSPRYGEHRARYWLDAARYGDTHGLHLDNVRSIWPYRDWVIRAFNRNMPFDQFVIEQIAGDLLPNPTLEQKVATGFNRCNVTTSEGGSIAEEYRVRYAVDRVEAIGTVFLGLTVGCAVCHEHKFDPISHKEFYQLFDFYANTADRPMDGNALLPPPSVKVPSAETKQQLAKLDRELADLQKTLREKVAAVNYVEPKNGGKSATPKPREIVWIDDALPPGAVPQGNESAQSWKWVDKRSGPVFHGEKSHTRTTVGYSQHYFTGAKPGLKIDAGDRLFAYVFIDPKNPPKTILLQFNNGNWEHRAYWGANTLKWGRNNTPSRRGMGKIPAKGKWVRLEVDAQHVGLKPGSTINGMSFGHLGGTLHWDAAGIVKPGALPTEFASFAEWETVQKKRKKSNLPKHIQSALNVPQAKRNAAQKKQLLDYFIEHAYSKTRKSFAKLHQQIAANRDKKTALEKTIPSTLVMQEKTANRLPTYVLTRGEYDKPDKTQRVSADTPRSLGSLPKHFPKNRLGLAKWLVDPQHPLTARVTVNRFWQQYFGTGIVKTTEDFGSQGEFPTHPDLLDWLARSFIDSGWDVKKLHKTIVMSATYRQSSRVTPELYRRDPENRLLARGPRFRLDAEAIRDNALFVSGLLVEKLGGPSVKPYQPKGLWKAVGYTDSNTANFVQDHGEKLYRRSMYTFWKRTSPPPSMAAFDAPSRESCTVRRERTNTPMQALLLMNDIQFVEASRKFAERIMKTGGKSLDEKMTFAFRSATARRPSASELKVMKDVYQSYLAEYRKNPQAAAKLLSVGESPRDQSLNQAELAAWAMTANLILNLDETITKG
ncbi:MAG: PSD1 and planctomycete cytochrome C domain-containing protein [Planctomycetaceae bacterium]